MIHLDGDTIVDQPEGRREHFVPLHPTDAVEFLAQHPSLSGDQQSQFRQVAGLIFSLLHQLYRQRHEQMTCAYAPLDPDHDGLLRTVPTPAYRQKLADELFDRVQDVLNRANYHRLGTEDIQQAITAASKWGVRIRVNFEMLNRLEVYGRGFMIGHRDHRNWRRFFRKERVPVPLYQRLIVVFRVAEEVTSDQFDSRRMYLRMFKNVPRQDIDMMLPATGIQMTWLDHSRIVVPSLYAAAITLWRFLRNVVLLAFFGVFKTLALIVLGLLAIGFGIKSMFTYRINTRRRYLLNMAQSLYFQNLDNNAGVLLRLLEEAEQQQSCEIVLAYFVSAILLADRGPVSLAQIDAECEGLLLEATGLHVDFDVASTAKVMLQIGVLQVEGDGWRALPPEAAIERLDQTWDDWFITQASPHTERGELA